MADIELNMDNMKITVTEDSLKTSGIELAKSHIHLAKTTMTPSRPLTLVIWIENFPKEEMEKIEGLPKTERVQLVRYSKEGKLAKRYQAFRYEGMLHGLSYAMQAIKIKPKELTRTEGLGLYWVWNRYQGKMKLCLALSNMDNLDKDTEFWLTSDEQNTERTTMVGIKPKTFTKIPTEIWIEESEGLENVTKQAIEEYNLRIQAAMQTN